MIISLYTRVPLCFQITNILLQHLVMADQDISIYSWTTNHVGPTSLSAMLAMVWRVTGTVLLPDFDVLHDYVWPESRSQWMNLVSRHKLLVRNRFRRVKVPLPL